MSCKLNHRNSDGVLSHPIAKQLSKSGIDENTIDKAFSAFNSPLFEEINGGFKEPYITNNIVETLRGPISVEQIAINPLMNSIRNNSTEEYISNSIKRNVSRNLINTMKLRIGKMFPNIKVNIVSSDMGFEGVKSVVRDGQIYLNKDLLTHDTYLHELSHVYLLILENSNPTVFNRLLDEAKSELANNTLIAKIATKLNTGESEAVILHEIMSIKASMVDKLTVAEIIKEHSTSLQEDIDNTLESNNGFINTIGNFLNTLFNKIFYKADLSNLDYRSSTLQSIGLALNDALQNGTLVDNISSEELALINTYGDLYSKQAKTKIDNLVELMEDLTNRDGFKAYKTLSDSEKVNVWFNQIRNSTARFITNITKEPIEIRDEQGRSKFTDDELRTYITDKIIPEKEKSDNMISSFVKDALIDYMSMYQNNNLSDMEIDNMLSKFGTRDILQEGQIVKVPILNRNSFYKLLKQIDFNSTNTFHTLEDFMNDNGLTEYASLFKGLDAIVKVNIVGDKKIVTLHKLTTEHLNANPSGASNQFGLLDAPLEDKERNHNIPLKTSFGDMYYFMLSIAGKALHTNADISVDNISVISFRKDSSESYSKSGYDTNNLLRDLQNIPNIEKIFRNSQLEKLIKTNTRDVNILWEDYIQQIWSDVPYGVRGGIDQEYQNYNDIQDNDKKYNALSKRLKSIEHLLVPGNAPKFMQDSLRHERKVIVNVLTELKWGRIYENQLSSKWEMNAFQLWYQTVTETGNEYIQLVHGIASVVDREIVDNVMNSKRKLGQAYLNTVNRNGDIRMRVSDQSTALWDKSLAKIDVLDLDGNKKQVPIMYLMWSKTQGAFAEQAQSLTEEELKDNEVIAEELYQYVRRLAYHKITKNGDYKDWKTRTKFGEEDIDNMLNQWGYEKGMLPVMGMKSEQLIAKGKWLSAAKEKINELSSAYTVYEGMDSNDKKVIDEIENVFERQFSYNEKTAPGYGSISRLSLLGIEYRPYAPKGEEYILKEKSQAAPSDNVELLADFFMMAIERKIQYENKVLPITNGVRAMLHDYKYNNSNLHENINPDKIMEYMDMYTERAIHGRVEKADLGIVEPIVSTTTSLLTYSALAFQPGLFVASASINLVKAYTAAISNDLSGVDDFGVKELTEASAIIFDFTGGWQKASQLAVDYGVVNASQYETITHYSNKKTDKNLVSDYSANFNNWSTDMFARTVIMVAQMKKDGVWNSMELDKENRTVKYNYKADKRFFDDKGVQTDEQKFKLNFYKKKFMGQYRGKIASMNEDLKMPYLEDEIARFKYLSDKYVIGGYTKDVSVNLSNKFLGRIFNVFSNYLSYSVSNAFKKGEYTASSGRWKTIKMDNNEFEMKWEREWVEGYFNTVSRHITELFKGKRSWSNPFADMNVYEKRNYIRIGVSLMMFVLMYAATNGLIDDDDDENDIGLLPDWKVLQKLKASYNQFLILPQISAKLNQPFAWTNMIDRMVNNIGNGNILKTVSAADQFYDMGNKIANTKEEIREQLREENN